MTSASPHLDSEQLATTAHAALREGNVEKARALFADAAQAEAEAFGSVPDDKPRTLGILAVSTAALWFKAGDVGAVERFAQRALAIESLPPFARRQLHDVLQTIERQAPPR